MHTRTLTALISVAVAPVSLAGVVEFENEQRPDFFAAVGGPGNVSTVDFTGYPDLTPITDQWAHLGVHFSSSGSVVTRGPGFVIFPNDGWGTRGEPEINMTFDAPINWSAADFPGVNHVIELYYDDVLIYTSGEFGTGGPGQFGGLISDDPFDSARIFNNFSVINFVDDLHFGPPINVPGPGALALVLYAPLQKRQRRRRG